MAYALPIALIASAVLGAGATAYAARQSSRGISSPSKPPEMPQLPGPLDLPTQRERAGRASTLLTRPSGLSEPATFKPTLLGQ